MRGTFGSLLLFRARLLRPDQGADRPARNWWDPEHLFPSSKLHTNSPCAFCLPESVSERPSRHYICKRRTTSLLKDPEGFERFNWNNFLRDADVAKQCAQSWSKIGVPVSR